MKVAFHTLGCKVNQYETNAMTQQFVKAGYEAVEFNSMADIYVINTCTVTNMSDRKTRQMLRKAKNRNKESILIAVGCYAQVNKEGLEKLEEIDLILGINEKNDIVKQVEEYLITKGRKIDITDVMTQQDFLDFGDITYTENARAVIKIQDGCNQFCTYCIIPYARGRVRSRLPENIFSEIEKIANNEIKEVVLTGIHIASYGKDFKDKKYALIDLLEEINKIQGIERIRLGSLEPTLITQAFMNRLIKLDKICDHFHLSMQSGCNETLKRMNRRYTVQEFKNAVDIIRKKFEQASITTDIIVGFPGETEQEFAETYEFVKSIHFYKTHIFKYSKRDGTKAAIMPNQVEEIIKEERSKKLIALSDKYENETLNTYIGKRVKVLFEEETEEYAKGHTTNYMMVKIKTNGDICDKIREVVIKRVEGLVLTGTL